MRRAFTVIELLVVIGIVGVLLAILLPAAEHVRHQAYIDKCASNLRQIGLALSIYENENRGAWPRTTYDPATADAPTKGTGATAADPFVAGSGVLPNDLTAGLFLLMMSFAAAGLFVSSLTREPTIAAVASFGLLLVVWLINILAYNDSVPFKEVFAYLSLIDHFESLRRGVFATADAIYYVLFSALFLSLTVLRLDIERA